MAQTRPYADYARTYAGGFAAQPSRRLSREISKAEGLCRSHGARLTPIRRRVLEALYSAQKPVGAYDLVEMLSANGGRRMAPITVYRALDFLIEQGLAHRLASQNAYVASTRESDPDGTVAFLICETCGRVEEAASQDLSEALSHLMAQNGLRLTSKVLEITGQCARCQNGTH